MMSRGYVLDGNFSAEHLRMKCPEDEVILGDGTAFFVREKEYKNHLLVAVESKQVSAISFTYYYYLMSCAEIHLQ
jgi:hypothetical protein